MNFSMPDPLDQQVTQTLRGTRLGAFLTELFQGVGQIALFLLILEAIWDWNQLFDKPDVYVLLVMVLCQTTWLSQRRFSGLPNPWWTQLVGLALYVMVETLIEGPQFFNKPKHQVFIALSLMFAVGWALETWQTRPTWSVLGTVLARSAQGLAPLLFYMALDLRDQAWREGLAEFFTSAAHLFLLALAVTQMGALIALSLMAQRQTRVIGTLLEQLKTLSRWGFGSNVVQKVIQDQGHQAASRVERAIGFIDIRGFTAWSESHPPEAVIDMLNHFYAAVLQACGPTLIKSKMSGDEVLMVLPASPSALNVMQLALQAATQAVAPMNLTAGAGLWLGPVVEGFFGAKSSPIHDVIGDTVNTAKRLCDHAHGGQLLAGPIGTWPDQPQKHIDVQAKGKHQPVQALVFSQLDLPDL